MSNNYDEMARKACFCCCTEDCRHLKPETETCISCKAIASAIREAIDEQRKEIETILKQAQQFIDRVKEQSKQLTEKDAIIARLKKLAGSCQQSLKKTVSDCGWGCTFHYVHCLKQRPCPDHDKEEGE